MLPVNRVIRTFLIMCSPLALAACAAAPVPVPVAPRPVATAEPEAEGGIYKVGKPYQVEGLWYYPGEDYAYAQEGIASWYGTDFHGKRTANGDKYDMNDLTAAHPTLPMPSVVKVTNLDNGRTLKVTVNDRGPFHSSRIIDVSRRAAQLLGFYEAGTAHVRVEIDAQESINLKNIALAKHPPEMPAITAAPRAAVAAVTLEPLAGATIASAAPVNVQQVKPVVGAPDFAQIEPKKPAAKAPASSSAKAAPTKTAPSQTNPAKVANASPSAKPAATAPAHGTFVQAGAFSEEANARKLEQQLGELGTVHIVPGTAKNKKVYRVRLGPIADASAATALLGKVKSYGYNDAKVVRE